MRYTVLAVALAFVFMAAGYAAYAFDAGSTGNYPGQAGPVISVSEHPDRPVKTCSGDVPRFGAQQYFFGFTRPGLCMTTIIFANTYGEAKECAIAMCPDCRIEDITGWYQFSSSIRDQEGRTSFCPAK